MQDSANQKIIIEKNGPCRVFGDIPLEEEIIVSNILGIAQKWKQGKKFTLSKGQYSLCRCGQTKNPPYCDGTHKAADFDGTETADNEDPFADAQETAGPELILADVKHLCASARFCLRSGGIWKLTEESDIQENRDTAIEEAHQCPAGRLVVKNRVTKEPIEPNLEPSISIVKDEHTGRRGPLWVKGYIRIESADGTMYEPRNRVTLCCCGKSKNKPFCNGIHVKE